LGSHTVTLYFFVSDMLFLLSWCFFVTFRKPPGFREKAYRVLDLEPRDFSLWLLAIAPNTPPGGGGFRRHCAS